MLFFTDPLRTPAPSTSAARLPKGCGVVFRAYGAADAAEQGRALARVCRRRRLTLFVGADPALAARVGADGVHLPQRLAGRAGLVRRLRARFLVTAAAHDLPAALRARRAGAQVLVISPVFASNSLSAGRAMGARALARLARAARIPVYALGGVNADTARALKRAGAVGLAAVEALGG